MDWNHWIRQSHGWLSVVFTLTVVANFVVRTQPAHPQVTALEPPFVAGMWATIAASRTMAA